MGQEADYVTSLPQIFRKNTQRCIQWGGHLEREECVLLLFRIVGNLIIIAFKYPTDSAPPFCLHLGQTTPVALSLIYH